MAVDVDIPVVGAGDIDDLEFGAVTDVVGDAEIGDLTLVIAARVLAAPVEGDNVRLRPPSAVAKLHPGRTRALHIGRSPDRLEDEPIVLGIARRDHAAADLDVSFAAAQLAPL
jgi:hypothetical protein